MTKPNIEERILGGYGTWYADGWGDKGVAASALLVSSVRIEKTPGTHDVLHIWNRGGKAGELTVNRGDGKAIMQRLLGPGAWKA